MRSGILIHLIVVGLWGRPTGALPRPKSLPATF